MRKVVFDIETKNTQKNGKMDVRDLEISVVCIHDSERNTYSCYFESELPELWRVLEHTHMLIGYNSNHFDIPLLNRYYPGDLSRIKSIDLLHEIKRAGGRRVRLDAVAEGTLGEKKKAHGLQAIEWWENGELDKLKDYCRHDVELTKRLYDYALAHGSLKYVNLGDVREVKLDTSHWEAKDKASMTHTLPF